MREIFGRLDTDECSLRVADSLIEAASAFSKKETLLCYQPTSQSPLLLRQEGVIAEALGRIAMVTERYPELKANQNYSKTIDAVQTVEGMARTSRLIYNDSVTKLNREIRMFPVSIIAGMLGFGQRDYLEEQAGKTGMPSMK